MTITTHEKLIAVESMIERARTVDSGHPEIPALKAIAKDLRARLDGAPSVALHEIERRMTAVQRSRTPSPTRTAQKNGAILGLGEELICRWPVVKQALELFGASAEMGRK